MLLGPKEIVNELIRGNVLCPLETAASALKNASNLSLCDKVDLLACDRGWIWVLYYSDHPRQTATHFSFVHADGNRLLNTIAQELLDSAVLKTHALSNLEYLRTLDVVPDKNKARNEYYKYSTLNNETRRVIICLSILTRRNSKEKTLQTIKDLNSIDAFFTHSNSRFFHESGYNVEVMRNNTTRG